MAHVQNGGRVMCKQPTAQAPCVRACPAGVDVPRYVRLIADGRFSEALAVIREKIPFPSVCGRACFAPCESACHAALLTDPVSIRALKSFVAEQVTVVKESPPSKLTGRSVGIIGAGPAGLTAAYYLAKRGHAVTIFEALPEPGGMMRVGIPAYRLPKDILKAEIERIESIGVEIRTNTRVDSLDALFSEGYNAIFLAIGAHQGVKMDIEGEDNPRVMGCVSFLKDVNLGKEVALGNRVAVIGGSSAAIDAARTALRFGATEVTVVYRRTRAEMLASPDEIEAALSEGLKTCFLAAPSRIIGRNGEVQLECIRTRLGAMDASGRRRPEPVKNSEFSMSFDTIIVAIGQRPEIPRELNLPVGPGNTIQVDPDTLATNREGLFAGGDVVSGPASIIEAIAAGRQAATSIDKYLGGEGIIDESLVAYEESILPVGFQPVGERIMPPSLPMAERLSTFDEVELRFSDEIAIREAKRCLRCDLPIIVDLSKCAGCRTCELRCSLRWEGAFIPAKAKVTVTRLVGNRDHEFDISFSSECDCCGICVKYCPYGALTRGSNGEV